MGLDLLEKYLKESLSITLPVLSRLYDYILSLVYSINTFSVSGLRHNYISRLRAKTQLHSLSAVKNTSIFPSAGWLHNYITVSACWQVWITFKPSLQGSNVFSRPCWLCQVSTTVYTLGSYSTPLLLPLKNCLKYYIQIGGLIIKLFMGLSIVWVWN